MTEADLADIRRIAREEALKAIQPLVMAVRQGNRRLDGEIEKLTEEAKKL